MNTHLAEEGLPAIVGTITSIDALTQPRRWKDLEVDQIVAVPNACANYFDHRWTAGMIKTILVHPPRGSASATPSYEVEVAVSKYHTVWIGKLQLLRPIPSD